MFALFNYAAQVVRVVDGDTLDVSVDLGFRIYCRLRVRLAGINAPEVFGAKATQAGKEAAEFVVDWIASGSRIVLHSKRYDDREKYGRVLAVVYRDDDPVSLNDAMLQAGKAVPSVD